MELEVLRMVADWLAGTTDPTYGVNTLLADVELDGSDAAPPLIATFADASRAAWVARQSWGKEGGATLPALAVFAQPFDLDGEVQTSIRDARLDVVVAYVAEKSDSKLAKQHALYTRRAIVRSLKQFHANANADTARTRGNVAILACLEMKAGGAVVDWQDAMVTDGVQLTYLVRDLAP